MKLKRIKEESNQFRHYPPIKNPMSVGYLHLDEIYWEGVDGQLEACEKEATEKEQMWQGYTEMAVREIFEELESHMGSDITGYRDGLVAYQTIPTVTWQDLKQSTLKKYGGEK